MKHANQRCAAQLIEQHALSEHEHQVRFFLLVDHLMQVHPRIAEELADVWAVPNGGHRLPAVAGKLKAEGVRRAVPDITCMVPRGVFHGLVIEMKKFRGKATPEQRQRLERLARRGYAAHCTQGWVNAGKTLCTYLEIPWREAWEDRIEWQATAGRRARRGGRRWRVKR